MLASLKLKYKNYRHSSLSEPLLLSCSLLSVIEESELTSLAPRSELFLLLISTSLLSLSDLASLDTRFTLRSSSLSPLWDDSLALVLSSSSDLSLSSLPELTLWLLDFLTLVSLSEFTSLAARWRLLFFSLSLSSVSLLARLALAVATCSSSSSETSLSETKLFFLESPVNIRKKLIM